MADGSDAAPRPELPTASISVICPCYNTNPTYLWAAATAVLTEPSGQVVELLLADDASTDTATQEALAAIASTDPRVRVLRADRNGGPARARNLALAVSRAPWVGFTDADDLWLPNHLAPLRTVLAENPSAGWVCANHAILHPDGAQTPLPLLSTAHPGEPFAPGLVRYRPPASTRALAGNYWLHLGGCLVRTDLARAAGFAENCTYSEDWLFFLRLSAHTDLFYADAPGYLLRRQHASLTTSPRRLTDLRLTAKRAALRDPSLRAARRDLRWALLATYKGLAANNLLAGHPARALRYAAHAYAMDPRAITDARAFASALAAAAPHRRERLRRYTASELA